MYTGNEENTSETVIDLGDHQFTGELNMLSDQPALVAARTTVPSLLLRVTRGDLRRLMRAEGEIANLILQALIWRRIGFSLCSRAVVIATGAQYRKLPLENFETFENLGHRLCSHRQGDGLLSRQRGRCRGRWQLRRTSCSVSDANRRRVYIMVRGKSLAATMSQYLLSRIEQSRRITILTETEIVSLEGRSHLEQVTWVNRGDGSETTRAIEDLFVMIGAQPNTYWLKGVVALD